jgi:pimeloyl-ACP methyl ester carboxylesterase
MLLRNLVSLWVFVGAFAAVTVAGQAAELVVDIPTRPGVMQRFLHSAPTSPRAAVVLIAGGTGQLQIDSGGNMPERWVRDNFVVRTRDLFLAGGFATAVIDAPSDRQSAPYLGGFRQTAEHLSDIKSVVAWLRGKYSVPVWLIGTSNGTLSAAYVATQTSATDGGPDGAVLTATILVTAGVPNLRPVLDMELQKVTIPVLVVHHEDDGCKFCPFSSTTMLLEKLKSTSNKELLSFRGGKYWGDPCHEWGHHGFNSQEQEVVAAIISWILAH